MPTDAGGSILVAVVITVLAASSLVGALYVIGASANSQTARLANQRNLQAFADSTLGICDTLIDGTLGIGEYGLGASAMVLVSTAEFGAEQFDAQLTSQELYIQPVEDPGHPAYDYDPWFSDYDGTDHRADYVVRHAGMTAFLDLDHHRRHDERGAQLQADAAGPGALPEFGTTPGPGGGGGGGSEPQPLGVFRCSVRAQDGLGNRVHVYGMTQKFR